MRLKIHSLTLRFRFIQKTDRKPAKVERVATLEIQYKKIFKHVFTQHNNKQVFMTLIAGKLGI